MPITPFIGVLISWLMFARNSLLARLASSAAWAIFAVISVVSRDWARSSQARRRERRGKIRNEKNVIPPIKAPNNATRPVPAMRERRERLTSIRPTGTPESKSVSAIVMTGPSSSTSLSITTLFSASKIRTLY